MNFLKLVAAIILFALALPTFWRFPWSGSGAHEAVGGLLLALAEVGIAIWLLGRWIVGRENRG